MEVVYCLYAFIAGWAFSRIITAEIKYLISDKIGPTIKSNSKPKKYPEGTK